MTVNEVVRILEKSLPLAAAENYDNVGLLCGKQDREVTGILVCHDVLENVVQEAVDKGLNFIVAFHPIIFSGIKSITAKNYVEKAIMRAIENKIAIYAVHTAFDNHYFGVNYRICEELGLTNTEVLMPKRNQLQKLEAFVPADFVDQVKDSLFSAGAGNIGFYDECSFSVAGMGSFRPLPGSNPYSGTADIRENAPEIMVSVIYESYKKNQLIHALKSAHPYEEVAYQVISLENENQYSGLGRYGDLEIAMQESELLDWVKTKFDLAVIRHSPLFDKMIRRIGVLGGSGASGIEAAINKGCDAYLTGDLKYHDFFKAEDKILLCDIGHFESEQFVAEHLVELLSQKFTIFAVSKSTEKTNPVNYFL